MSTRLRVAAAALACLGLATACVRTTEGTVAMTTEPGPPLEQRETTARPTTSPTPGVPAPANAMRMTCDEFTDLDVETRLAVVREILATGESMFGPLGAEFAASMANTICQFMPDTSVYEVLIGSPPP